MTELKAYTTEELSQVIGHTANALKSLADGLDRQNEALKEICFSFMALNEHVAFIEKTICDIKKDKIR